MSKIYTALLSILLLITCLIAIRYIRTLSTPATYTIGILQTASHPALDAVCKGFVEELHKKFGNTVSWSVFNAQGSIAQAHVIAQQLYTHSGYSAFFTIGTPATQAMSALEKKRPIIIAAVTDPHALGIMGPEGNVCGVQDMIDVVATVDMVTLILPQAKNIGLLYTAGEANSRIVAHALSVELQKRYIQTADYVAHHETDIPILVESACKNVDAILAPTDHMVAATIPLLVARTHACKKPFIVSDNLLVKYGPLAACGVDYYESGKRAAEITCDILVHNKKPHAIPLEKAQGGTMVMNKDTMTMLHISIPAQLEQSIIFVEQE